MRSTTVLSFLFATATIAAPILEGVIPVGTPDLPTSIPDLDVTKDLDITKELDVDELTKSVPDLPVRRALGGLLSGLGITKSVPVSTSDLPLDTSSLPLDTSSLPLDTSSVPLDASSLPLDTSSLPLDRRSLPIDTSSLPLDTSSLPIDLSDLSLDASIVPDLPKRLLGLDSTLKTINSLLNDVLSLSDKVEADLLSLIGHLEDVDVQGVLNDVYSILNAVLAKVHTILKAEDADVDLSSLSPIINTITKELNSLAAEVQQLIDAGIVGDLIEEIKDVLDDVITLVENITKENLSS